MTDQINAVTCTVFAGTSISFSQFVNEVFAPILIILGVINAAVAFISWARVAYKKHFDKNNDGKVTKDELIDGLTKENLKEFIEEGKENSKELIEALKQAKDYIDKKSNDQN